MTPRSLLLILIVALSWGGGVRANDTSATLGAGGLTFERNASVRMVSERLRIARSRVEVEYVFRNKGRTDQGVVVAFPLPDINTGLLFNAPVEIPEGFPNFIGFRVWVDGSEVAPALETRSFDYAGTEITEVLRALEVDPFGEHVPLDAEDDLVETGVFDKQHRYGFWTTRASYHWRQVFPAGRDVHVRHVYRPVVGNHGAGGMVRADSEYLDEFCADASLRRAVAALKTDDYGVGTRRLEYVLTTGANWAGPIGEFSLVIDKEDADLITTCPIPGLTLRKHGTEFRATARNYTPTKDIDLLFIRGGCGRAGCAGW